jgi:hypothetical protein
MASIHIQEGVVVNPVFFFFIHEQLFTTTVSVSATSHFGGTQKEKGNTHGVSEGSQRRSSSAFRQVGYG